MFNPVQQLIIGKSSGAASTAITSLTADYASVVAGDVYVVNSAMVPIAAAANITPVIYIAQGTAAGKFKLSNPITVGNITSLKSEVYRAQTQKVEAVGNVGSGALDLEVFNGFTYRLTILFMDDQRFMPQRQTRRDYAFTANFAATVPTDAEKAAFIQQFVDAVNNDAFASQFVTAALNTTAGPPDLNGISITGKAQTYNVYNNRPEYVDFRIAFYDATDATSTYQATVTVVAPFEPGNGTYDQVNALERKLATWDGWTNQIQFPVIPPTFFTVPGTNYSLIQLTHFPETPGLLEGRDKKPLQVIFALTAGSAQFAAIVTALELLNNAGAGTISNNVSFVDADV